MDLQVVALGRQAGIKKCNIVAESLACKNTDCSSTDAIVFLIQIAQDTQHLIRITKTPIVVGGRVHVATESGSLYPFRSAICSPDILPKVKLQIPQDTG